MKTTGPPTAWVARGARPSQSAGPRAGHGPHGPEHTQLCQERVLGGGARKDRQRAGGSKGCRRRSGRVVEVLLSFPRAPSPERFWRGLSQLNPAWLGGGACKAGVLRQGRALSLRFSVIPRRDSSLACPCALGNRHHSTAGVSNDESVMHHVTQEQKPRCSCKVWGWPMDGNGQNTERSLIRFQIPCCSCKKQAPAACLV